MASHCHSHHRCHTPTTTSCCCCSAPVHHPPPPEPQLVIQCQSIHPTPPQSHFSSPCTPFNLQPHHRRKKPQQQPQYYYPAQTDKLKQHFRRPHLFPEEEEPEEEEEQELNPTISSLLHRIAALESSVRRHSSASFSLRDAAARTIQTHFRAFLVRRSQTLRQLKDLAFIKSALNTLKSIHSNNTHSDCQALHQKSKGLLNKLNLIQGSDPMIRDGKRSVTRDLIRFMDYLDELSSKRHRFSSRAVKNLRLGGTVAKSGSFSGDQRVSPTDCKDSKGDERELLEKLRKRVEKIEGFSRVSEKDEEEELELENSMILNNRKSSESIRNGVLMNRSSGVQGKAKKSVSFAENGNVYMVYRNNNGPVSVDAEELGGEVEEIGSADEEEEEEAHSEENESPQYSDGDRDSRRNLVTESDNEMHEPIENEDGSFVFSAPLPLKMEQRGDLLNRKKVKIII